MDVFSRRLSAGVDVLKSNAWQVVRNRQSSGTQHCREDVDRGDQSAFHLPLRKVSRVVDDHRNSRAVFVDAAFSSWEISSVIADVNNQRIVSGPRFFKLFKHHTDALVQAVHAVEVVAKFFA